MLTLLQFDVFLRGVKRWMWRSSSMRRSSPSIQPKHSAWSTACSHERRWRPVLLLVHPDPDLGLRRVVLGEPGAERLRARRRRSGRSGGLQPLLQPAVVREHLALEAEPQERGQDAQRPADPAGCREPDERAPGAVRPRTPSARRWAPGRSRCAARAAGPARSPRRAPPTRRACRTAPRGPPSAASPRGAAAPGRPGPPRCSSATPAGATGR